MHDSAVRVLNLGQVMPLGAGLLSLAAAHGSTLRRFSFACSRTELESVEGGTDEFFEVRPSCDSKSAARFRNSAISPRWLSFSASSSATRSSAAAAPICI